MKILVMDDETLALQRVQRLLKELGYTCTCVDTLEAFNALFNHEHFDLFILDINMPQSSGIDLAKRILHQQPSAFIIFQTAHEGFALQAFIIGAIDFLLKPFGKEELERSLERFLAYHKTKKVTFMTKNGNESYIVSPEDILYIQADLAHIMIRTKDHFSYLEEKISQMELLLDNTLFFRIHRSYLINTTKIKSMQTLEQSRIEFSFEGIKDVVISSKEGAKKFREMYKETK